MSYIPQSTDLRYEVSSTGKLGNKLAYIESVLGRRSLGFSSLTALSDIVEYLDLTQNSANTPTSEQTLYIVSSNVGDSSIGAGARTIRIVYLDALGGRQVTTVTLNGTTAVSLGVGFSYILYMEVASGTVALGNISITSTNGAATVATTFERISIGNGKSLSARYKVPTGYSAYMLDWDGFSIGTTQDLRLRATVFSNDRTLSAVPHFQDNMYLASNTNNIKSLAFLKCPAGSEIKVSTYTGALQASNRADASFTILVVQD